MNQTASPLPGQKPQQFSIEDVAHYPLPGTAVPGAITFHPDGRSITYLFSPEGTLTNRLYRYDLESGEQTLLADAPDGGLTDENASPEEALRRERQRQRTTGITAYAWSATGSRLLIPVRGELYVVGEDDSALRCIVSGQPPAVDPQFSPDGSLIAFIQDAELMVVPFTGGVPRQLTTGARESGKTHGLAEYIAQEEMGRARGFWWSPDSRRIAFTEVDETHIPVYHIVHQGKDETGPNAQEDHRYPFAGQANARVRLGIVTLEDCTVQWIDLNLQDSYLARVDWMPNGKLIVQLEHRSQTHLSMIAFDPKNGAQQVLLQENSDVWINLHDMFRPLKSGGFIWASERSGYRHLYLYDHEGTLIRPLTQGDWIVDSIAGVDEAQNRVYFTATRTDPRECHLFMTSFSGDEPQQITHASGTHTVVLDLAFRRFIDIYSTVDTPPMVDLNTLPGGDRIRTIFHQTDPRLAELNLRPPELIQLENRSGTRLYGAIYRPAVQFGSGPFPTIVQVYGGPHAQQVVNSWAMTANMRAQYLCSLGFLVFILDNRGSARRGLVFERAIQHNLGHAEVEDQVDGVHWLVHQGLADQGRVGIYGWSYGGYMAAMCLARASETFQAAVAGAPVTSWDGYDTHYTERYMGTPESNPAGYQNSSVMTHLHGIKGKLMLVHGLIDENVHFRHTARLINALVQARKSYDLLLFPDERHMPRREADRIYMEERIRDFFLDNI